MSAEAVPPQRQPWPGPDLRRQRLANHTVEDVLSLPDDAPRVELRDGVMIVVPSPTIGHQEISSLLWHWFRRHAPLEFRPSVATGVLIDAVQTFEPDVLLLHRETINVESHYSTPDQVALVVEVVSPSTRRRDRLEKPVGYAAAGIRHFWRVEQDPVHIYAYELVDGGYQLVADSADELVLAKPFELRLPIRDVTP
ncbi:Endonuclease, Uma2 family (restriction endonuclease fold) [Micromonospora pattaloongensis]|uniref:Endonuclease, Uma2 family (Restriction endonuclease fold) n=1 Tax=Micromonospora pattaloongensis TaxID=405436 RepID=A0A1H3GJN3_9ACTN|nr:Uma2 family endonuclease [Micromonospora pattaloongensis]SDY03307.1 Endonuclease, Uma2 family (restriction endonuclease fold) [Micromonospora pattaloongensis]